MTLAPQFHNHSIGNPADLFHGLPSSLVLAMSKRAGFLKAARQLAGDAGACVPGLFFVATIGET